MCLHDNVATCTAEFRTHVADDAEAGRHIFQPFRHVFSKVLESAAVGRTGCAGWLQHAFSSLGRCWVQWLALDFLARRHFHWRLSVCNSRLRFQIFELQFQLFEPF